MPNIPGILVLFKNEKQCHFESKSEQYDTLACNFFRVIRGDQALQSHRGITLAVSKAKRDV